VLILPVLPVDFRSRSDHPVPMFWYALSVRLLPLYVPAARLPGDDRDSLILPVRQQFLILQRRLFGRFGMQGYLYPGVETRLRDEFRNLTPRVSSPAARARLGAPTVRQV